MRKTCPKELSLIFDGAASATTGEAAGVRHRNPAGPIKNCTMEVESLLAAHESSGSFLAEPVLARKADVVKTRQFVCRDGRVKILDFGLAQLIHQGVSGSSSTTSDVVTTEAGRVFGTVEYMSPEQARGQPARPSFRHFHLSRPYLVVSLVCRPAGSGSSPAAAPRPSRRPPARPRKLADSSCPAPRFDFAVDFRLLAHRSMAILHLHRRPRRLERTR